MVHILSQPLEIHRRMCCETGGTFVQLKPNYKRDLAHAISEGAFLKLYLHTASHGGNDEPKGKEKREISSAARGLVSIRYRLEIRLTEYLYRMMSWETSFTKTKAQTPLLKSFHNNYQKTQPFLSPFPLQPSSFKKYTFRLFFTA